MVAEADFDFNQLAAEAAKTAYDPRARRCWPWSHEWTMWQEEPAFQRQSRRCLNCGRMQASSLKRVCVHGEWTLLAKGNITSPGASKPSGHYWTRECGLCAEIVISKAVV